MELSGLIVAMATPLTSTGQISEASTRKLVNRLLNAGVHGLFVLGTNGEFYALSTEEKLQLVEIVVDEVRGRVPVYAGAGGISTNEVISLTNQMTALGVAAVSIITPYLISLTDDEILQHYQAILANTSLPIILYNIPANTKNSLSAHVVKTLAQEERIVGIKDSSGDLDNLAKYLEIKEDNDFSVLVGSDSKILAGLQLGADGAVAATANVITKTDLAIYELFKAGDIEQAEIRQKSIDAYRMAAKCGSVPAGLKLALNIIGADVGQPRLPVLPISDETAINEMREVLETYNEIENYWEV